MTDKQISNKFWKVAAEYKEEQLKIMIKDVINGICYSDSKVIHKIKFNGNEEIQLRIYNVNIYSQPELPEGCVLKIKGLLCEIKGEPLFEVCYEYKLTEGKIWLEESISLRNVSGGIIVLETLHFGLSKKLYDKYKGWVDSFDNFTLTSIPTRRYRSHVFDRMTNSFTANDLVYTGWGQKIPTTCEEGWLWGNEKEGLLICKYNLLEMEYSRFGSFVEGYKTGINRALNDTYLFLGGASIFRGDPEGALSLGSGDSYIFGMTRYAVYYGNWQNGYYLYRQHLEEMGHVLPEQYNPPIHWNELYNLGWFAEGTEKYTKDQLVKEAELASDIGAESLYLDPGWDVFPGSCVWDKERLGNLEDFIKTIKYKYSLKVSLHLMQNFLSDKEEKRFYSRNKKGETKTTEPWGLDFFCANEFWIEEKSKRICELAEQGVSFLMFDFHEFDLDGGGCQDPSHGHEVPMKRQTHVENIFKVVQNVKKKYPQMLIELHDRINGGYTGWHAMYFQHNLPNCHNENWGYEFMWNPMLDLLSGRAFSLYEYNLAYPIPLYLHINEGVDNINMLQFWWYASVVRHLGIGGVKKEDRNYKVLKSAMKLYMSLKLYFTSGKFYGIDPLAHLHINEKEEIGVLTCFNLTSSEHIKAVRINRKHRLKQNNISAFNGIGDCMEYKSTIYDNGDIGISINIPSLSSVILTIG